MCLSRLLDFFFVDFLPFELERNASDDTWGEKTEKGVSQIYPRGLYRFLLRSRQLRLVGRNQIIFKYKFKYSPHTTTAILIIRVLVVRAARERE